MKKSKIRLLAGILIPAILLLAYEIGKRWKNRDEDVDFIEDILKPALRSTGKSAVGLLLIGVLRRGILPERIIDILIGLSDDDMEELFREITVGLKRVL